MRYLLDANILISLAIESHVFHDRAEQWIESLKKNEDTLASCSTAELAFVRVLTRVPEGDLTVADAKRQMASTKARLHIPVDFIADDHGANKLPPWMITSKQTTDGHLAELAKAHCAALATLDARIPGSFVIPEVD